MKRILGTIKRHIAFPSDDIQLIERAMREARESVFTRFVVEAARDAAERILKKKDKKESTNAR